MDRQFTRPQHMLMWAYLEARVLDEAIREAQSTPEAEGPEAIFPMCGLGCAYAVAGQQSAALQMVEKLLALTDQFSLALVQARASAPDLATKTARSSLWKESLVRDDRLLWIKVDPRFDNLRADKRYDASY